MALGRTAGPGAGLDYDILIQLTDKTVALIQYFSPSSHYLTQLYDILTEPPPDTTFSPSSHYDILMEAISEYKTLSELSSLRRSPTMSPHSHGGEREGL